MSESEWCRSVTGLVLGQINLEQPLGSGLNILRSGYQKITHAALNQLEIVHYSIH